MNENKKNPNSIPKDNFELMIQELNERNHRINQLHPYVTNDELINMHIVSSIHDFFNAANQIQPPHLNPIEIDTINASKELLKEYYTAYQNYLYNPNDANQYQTYLDCAAQLYPQYQQLCNKLNYKKDYDVSRIFGFFAGAALVALGAMLYLHFNSALFIIGFGMGLMNGTVMHDNKQVSVREQQVDKICTAFNKVMDKPSYFFKLSQHAKSWMINHGIFKPKTEEFEGKNPVYELAGNRKTI